MRICKGARGASSPAVSRILWVNSRVNSLGRGGCAGSSAFACAGRMVCWPLPLLQHGIPFLETLMALRYQDTVKGLLYFQKGSAI
ncbi:hypothetical protein DUNSADRAFT_831 [Dunaliella salina]|uniref:Uncharacterized protein n=1 Tax=Dunaliella salina TaxID=3046 RepID=A0ABQ7GXU4_DUNSA|nr:hypothetical protein DUNSADRAFT_831 [Dunaliella salina]|eukprot:KAF5839429.1 hypothetical protein DUNSADRAFT_831 [Dunaliella salina]